MLRIFKPNNFAARVFILIVLCGLLFLSLPIAKIAVLKFRHSRNNLPFILPNPKDLREISGTTKNDIFNPEGDDSNLPVVFWSRNKLKPPKFNNSCAQFPDILALEYNNIYWQTLTTTNGTFQLFNAYLDDRKRNLLAPAVRILGMLNRIEPTVATHCQIWFEGQKKPVIVKTAEYRYVWQKKWGNYRQGIYQPYLMTCRIPKSFQAYNPPAAVSLVEKPCDRATTFLKVANNKPQADKKDFAVCVKGLNFPTTDISVELIEWIELIGLLGADKIFFYELSIHPNIKKVLRYYEERKNIHVTPLTLPGGQPNAPILQHFYLKNKIIHKRQNELVPYNDCFYKHMYEYKFIVLLDVDEVIMPVEGNTWKELLDLVTAKANRQKNVARSTYNARNVYFFDKEGQFKDIPRYMHMLQRVYRSHNYTRPNYYVKSFFSTENVLLLHNHFPLGCLGVCSAYAIDTLDAQLQHYRSDCVKELKKNCKDFKSNLDIDTTIWKHREALIEKVGAAMEAMGYFQANKG